jgi:uncharacterized membrane protein
MKKKYFNIMILSLMIISGYALYWTNVKRVEIGYFDDGIWIFWNSFAYVVFFGLITGFVLGNLLNRGKK